MIILIQYYYMYFRFILFRSNAGVTVKQLEETASQLETYLNQRFVHTLVRQQYCQCE